MKKTRPISGYELMRHFFDAYADKAAEKLLEFTGGETEFLELKATCVFDPNDSRNKDGETQNDLSWNIARELLALHNSKGGVLLIGIDDKKPFKRVPLPSYEDSRRNDYIKLMVVKKIFPDGSRWRTQNGRKEFSCEESRIRNFRNQCLEFDYVPYKDGEIVAIFVKPAPCQKGMCISVSYRENQGLPYDQLPTRETGNTGGITVYTTDKDKQEHEATRHRTDEHFARLWQKWDPQPHDDKTKSEHIAKAEADQGCDPSSDALIRAIEGCQQETEFSPNTMIGEYKVIRRIGKGGMGVVYEVEHPTLKTNRALKVFAPDDENDPLLQRKFLTEARLLARLNHPGLIRVHSLGVATKTSTLYYEMDLVCSDTRFRHPQTLKGIYHNIENAPPENKQLREWFSQISAVLHYLHSDRKIVHRDIKLENILLNERGFAILSDFGIAHISDKELKKNIDDGVTLNGTDSALGNANIGTPEYLAPELTDHEHPSPASPQSDIYAVGVMFFKLVTGRSYQQETGDELKKCLKGKPLFWRHTLPKLLARNPENRLSSLKRFAVKPRYPYVGVCKWTLRLLAVYALLHIVVIVAVVWSAKDKSAKLKDAWPVSDIPVAKQMMGNLSAATSLYFAETPFFEPPAMEAGPLQVEKPTIEPVKAAPLTHKENIKTSKTTKRESAITLKSQMVNDSYTTEEITQAQNDLRNLSYRYIEQKIDSQNEDWLVSEITEIHRQMSAVNCATKELLDLGMEIDEVFKSRKDLVYACINIRRKATTRINVLIEEAEYQKALKLYKATNDKFRSCGFDEIPRPSFTPR